MSLFIFALTLTGCASNGPQNYVAPTSGPMATVHLYAPVIQTSAANTEIDFEVFEIQTDCSLASRGWIKLTPSDFNKAITVVANAVLLVRIDYFQTDIVLARNSRGEVKFAIEPVNDQQYTVEYKGTGTRFDMDIWQGQPSAGVQGNKVVPLEWNERNGKVLYRGKLNCAR